MWSESEWSLLAVFVIQVPKVEIVLSPGLVSSEIEWVELGRLFWDREKFFTWLSLSSSFALIIQQPFRLLHFEFLLLKVGNGHLPVFGGQSHVVHLFSQELLGVNQLKGSVLHPHLEMVGPARYFHSFDIPRLALAEGLSFGSQRRLVLQSS